MSVAFDGDDLVSVVVGRTCEMFPVDDDFWQELYEIVDAVLVGRIMGRERPEQTAAVLGSGSSQIEVGACPAESRAERRYPPDDHSVRSVELSEQA